MTSQPVTPSTVEAIQEGGGPRVGVTGASGYLGQAVMAEFDLRDVEAIPLCRHGAEGPPYRLGDDVELSDFDVVVHLAWSHTHRSRDEYSTNVGGSVRLLDSASRSNTRFVFVSSVSAFAEQRSSYGHAKAVVERAVEAAGGFVVRPGLVVDEPLVGLPAALRAVALRLPVLPLPMADSLRVWTVRRATVARAIADAALTGRTQAITSDLPTAITLRELATAVQFDMKSPRRVVSIPGWLSSVLLGVASGTGARGQALADSFSGLLHSQGACSEGMNDE